MRFQLYLYKSGIGLNVCMLDNSAPIGAPGAVYLRDTSNYIGDECNMVWKRASFPDSVMETVSKSAGFVIAEACSSVLLDANIDFKVLMYIWDSYHENVNQDI